MAQAIVDPAELRRFAHHLKEFGADLQDRLGILQGRLAGLADTWRDQEHERFAQDFEQTLRVLEAFLKQTELHVPYLLRKADKIEAYLQQR